MSGNGAFLHAGKRLFCDRSPSSGYRRSEGRCFMKQYRRSVLAAMALLTLLQGCRTAKLPEERKETAAPQETSVTAVTEQSAPLHVLILAEEGKEELDTDDEQLLKTFTDLFEEIGSVTVSDEEVIFLPDAPYELIGNVIFTQGDRIMEYSLLAHHSDAWLKDAENVIYVVLSENGLIGGYLIPEGSDLHRRTEEFTQFFRKG